MTKIDRFEDIDAWKASREMTREIYNLSTDGQFAKDFGLRDQLRRAAVSIMSNIAEGFERGGDKEFARYLAMAKGSAGEVRAQLYVALDAGYIDQDVFTQLYERVQRISRQLAGLMKYLKG